MIPTYRPSGRFGVPFLVLLPIGAAVGFGLSWVYQLLVDLIPIIWLNFLATLGLGFAVAMLSGFAVKTGKCRSPFFGVLAALIFSAAAIGGSHWFEYRSWVGKVAEFLEKENDVDAAHRKAVLDQFSFGRYVEMRAETGWTVGRVARKDQGPTISGVFVYLIWLIEAGIVAVMALASAASAAKEPFSETCDGWATEDRGKLTVQGPSDRLTEQIRRSRTVQELLAVPVELGGPGNTLLSWAAQGHPADPDEAFLSVVHTTVTTDKKGKPQTKNETILGNAVLGRTDLAAYQEFLDRVEQQLAATSEATNQPQGGAEGGPEDRPA